MIEKIVSNNFDASFKFTKKDSGYIILHSEDLLLKSHLSFEANILKIKIQQLDEKKKAIEAQGNIFLDTNTLKAYTHINFNIHNDANLSLYALADTKQLDYTLKSHKKIKSLKHLITMAHLPKEVIYWAYDAITMKNVQIKKFRGFIDYNNIKDAYKNIVIEAIVNKLNYKYNPKLDAVHAKTTKLEFKNGTLYIYPKQAYSYGMYLGKSWLKIDFTKKEELLTLHLLFKGKVNKDILKILNTYKIKLPFLQKRGDVDTNLTIKVGLRNIDVDAQGKFFTKQANFDYLGLNVDIYNARIRLNNYDVTIKNMQASLKDIAKADVDVKYNAKSSQGTVKFKFNHIALSGATLAQKVLRASYNISPKGDSIDVDKSHWRYIDKNISLDPLSMPFNLDTLLVHIPTSFFRVDNNAINGYISGEINVKKLIFDIDVDLLKLYTNGVELAQTTAQLKVHYDKFLNVRCLHDIYFSVNGSLYKMQKLMLDIKDKYIYLKRTALSIGDYISTKIYAKYNTENKKAHISLTNFTLINPRNQKILYKKKKIMLSAKLDGDNQLSITSKELNADFTLKENIWKLNIDSIGTIANNSPLLKHYKLINGEISFYRKKSQQYTEFDAHIKYPYAIVENKKEYQLHGKILKNGKLYFKINNNTSVMVNDKINIRIHKETVDIDQLIQAIKSLSNIQEQDTKTNIIVNAVDTNLYFGNNRYAISDKINIQYYDNILTAQLEHAKGYAGLKYADNTFHLYGHGFNDKFMAKLLSLSKFDGGSLDFSMSGKIDDYKAVFFINNTTIREYKLLNNILAFVNTVPSLITFSIPGYDKNGLFVKQSYIKFHCKNDLFHISDIYLDSKELKIVGKGKASIKDNFIDVKLNLKTDLGSNLSKVPLVGYILLDGDTISTTLKISGKLTDPTVKSLIAEDIVVAPLNIIQRTLTLPYKIIKDIKNLGEGNATK